MITQISQIIFLSIIAFHLSAISSFAIDPFLEGAMKELQRLDTLPRVTLDPAYLEYTQRESDLSNADMFLKTREAMVKDSNYMYYLSFYRRGYDLFKGYDDLEKCNEVGKRIVKEMRKHQGYKKFKWDGKFFHYKCEASTAEEQTRVSINQEVYGIKGVKVGMTLETVKSLHKQYPEKLGGNIKCKKASSVPFNTIECLPMGSTSIAGFESGVKYSFYKERLLNIHVSFSISDYSDVHNALSHKYGKKSKGISGTKWDNDISSIEISETFDSYFDTSASGGEIDVQHSAIWDERFADEMRNKKTAEERDAKARSNDL